MWSHYSLALTTLLSTALAAFGWALLVFYGGVSIPPDAIEWPRIASNFARCLAVFVLFSIAVLVPARRSISLKLSFGFGLVFLGCWQSLLNSLVETSWLITRPLELAPVPIGLLIAALGLHQLGKAYRKTRLSLLSHRHLEHELNRIDQLTQLYNRTQFFALGSRLLANQRPEQEPPQMLCFRVLNLTKINQALGFRAGDQVLAQLARAIKRHTRPEDVSGRLGARRLAVLSPSASQLNAERIAERVVRRCEHMILPDEQGVATPQQIDIEVIRREAKQGEDLEALLKRAGAVSTEH